MMRPIIAAFLLFGVFAGYGSAAVSAARHASGAHCGHAADQAGPWAHHRRWRRGHHEPAAPEGGSIQP